MKVLNQDFYKELLKEKQTFLSIKPYPWINATGFLKPGMRSKLIAKAPELGEKYLIGDMKRISTINKQEILDLGLSETWQNFIDDISSEFYKNFLREMLDIQEDFDILYEFAYENNRFYLGPHTDSPLKRGTQLFYLNDHSNWKLEWGGRTILYGNFHPLNNKNLKSMPLEEVISLSEKVYYADILNEESLFFKKTNDSWHSIEPIRCPNPGYNRRIFLACAFITKN